MTKFQIEFTLGGTQQIADVFAVADHIVITPKNERIGSIEFNRDNKNWNPSQPTLREYNSLIWHELSKHIDLS